MTAVLAPTIKFIKVKIRLIHLSSALHVLRCPIRFATPLPSASAAPPFDSVGEEDTSPTVFIQLLFLVMVQVGHQIMRLA